MSVFSKVTAWALLFAIALVSLVPPVDRPVTRVGHFAEHFLIYLALGFALGLGYANRWRVLASLVTFAATIELLQLLVPGRHARPVDFLVDAIAGCMGVVLSWIGTLAKRSGTRREATPSAPVRLQEGVTNKPKQGGGP